MVNESITLTRIITPQRRTDLLARPRLTELLYELLDHRLVLIVAPAGYGKSSLLIDMAHQIDLPVCWYALDPLDQDLQRFLAHIVATINYRFPHFGQRTTAVLQSNQLDLDRVLTALVNDIYLHVREHFVLVLDDYHFVESSEPVATFVNRLVQQVSENVHVVLASRTLPTLADLPLMAARAQVGGLDYEDLAFDAGEIQSLVLQNYRLTLPASVAEELVRETEGWITGLLLSALTMWRGMANQVRVARGSGVGLHDYLAQQVLDQQHPRLREFLLRSAFLEEFDAELCGAVLGSDEDSGAEGWEEMIAMVLRSNVFAVPLRTRGTWIRYHHLFRDFLQQRFTRERPEEARAILLKLAVVLGERGEWEKSYHLYRRLGDSQALLGLVERSGSELLRLGRSDLLASWLEELPAAVRASRPALMSLDGTVLILRGAMQEGLALLNEAATRFRDSGDHGALARTLARRAIAHRYLGDYHASLADSEEALACAPLDGESLPLHAEGLRTKGISLLKLGQLPEATTYLERSLSLYRELDEPHNSAILRMELGIVAMNSGKFTRARDQYEAALEYWRTTEDLTHQATLQNNLGFLYHLLGDYDTAYQIYEDALACARRGGTVRLEAVILTGMADLYADLDGYSIASALYREAHALAQQVGYQSLRLYLKLVEAELFRAQGEWEHAHALLNGASLLVPSGGPTLDSALYHQALGQLLLAEGKARAAIYELNEAVEHFDQGGQWLEGARAHLVLAWAHEVGGERPAALMHLERALKLAEKLDSWQPLVIAARQALPLLEMASSDAGLGQGAALILARVREFEHSIASTSRRLRQHGRALSSLTPRLSFQLLGQSQVLLDGHRIEDEEWQSRRQLRELFFCLLAHPGGLTREEAGAIFWPNVSAGKLNLNFRNAIYRLRQALGKDAILFEEERYFFNGALDYDLDVEHFESAISYAAALPDQRTRLATLEGAISLYQGRYLPDIEGTWVWPIRERLWQLFVSAILQVIEFHIESGNNQLALSYCQRALREDGCLEPAHRFAMRAHAAMGNRAGVVRQYEQCRVALAHEVGVTPSSQTEALYQTLIH